MANQEKTAELLQAQARLWNQTFNFINSASLKCAVQLGIPNAIHDHGKPISLSELVTSLHINPAKAHCIYRLMRVLVNSGFFLQEKIELACEEVEQQEEGNCKYSLTPASRLLLKEEPFDARDFLLVQLDPILQKPWNVLSDWFQNDDPTTFHTAHDMSFYDLNAKEPRLANLFNEAMAGDSRLITQVLINQCKYVFEGLSSLVDVGGGTGTVARAIANAFPDLKCTVFDLPHVIANMHGSDNLKFVGGDMFEAIPAANGILLKIEMRDRQGDGGSPSVPPFAL
ncbi:hypothetical protein RJ640_015722 [Escallonia rubra]|uniref:O-methyltransferase n=1 Tax=Escallonia rubra TaxID=112253 RepID=A0AA88RNJ7_9ASTE|nr:hypothetical protein RJ640_015722 [Escallonia rubra]